MDSLAGLNLSSASIPPTPTTPSQLPTFPPHPLSTGGGLGALSLGSAIGQPSSKPISQLGTGMFLFYIIVSKRIFTVSANTVA